MHRISFSCTHDHAIDIDVFGGSGIIFRLSKEQKNLKICFIADFQYAAERLLLVNTS